MKALLRKAAGVLSRSPLLSAGRRLWAQNEADYFLPLTKPQKLLTGVYIILHDYSRGQFPPTFTDQQKAYDGEIGLRFSTPGTTAEEFSDRDLRKPFWFGREVYDYLAQFSELVRAFAELGIQPGQRVLDLGCGTGWVSEFLALMKYDAVGVDISPDNIEDANKRIAGIRAKGITPQLRFVIGPMESVDEAVGDAGQYDAVFVFEALHHAYDWRRTLEAGYRCLRPGGWLLICNEPNVLHTCIAYRGARLTETHEIGLHRGDMLEHLRKTGFVRPRVMKNRVHLWVRTHWISAQKPR